MSGPAHTPANPALLALMVVLVMLIWGFNFIFGKIALRHLDALTLASFRVELAALFMVVVYFALPARWHEEFAGAGRQTRFSRRDLWRFAQLGLFGVAMNQTFFTIGLSYTSVGHAAFIVGMGPVFVLLLARAQGLERITARKVAAMALSFLGVIVLASEHGLSLHGGGLLGDLITMSGSLAFSFYAVLGKRVAAQYDSLAMNLYNFVFGAAMVLPVAVWRAVRLDWSTVGWQGWAGLVYMSAFASVLAYLIYYWALRHMAASRLAAFSYLLPLLATVLGVTLLGERITPFLLSGGSLVLVGVYLAERAARLEHREAEVRVVQP